MIKNACIIGAASGVGAALASHLHKSGWKVLAMDLNGPIRIDLADAASVQKAFKAAREEMPQLSFLAITAGMVDLDPLPAVRLEQWNRVIAVNLTGPMLCCQHAESWLADGARIVLFSSLAARAGGVTTGPAYAASKGGLESLTKSLAQHYAPRAILVNCIAPGAVDTPMLKSNSPENQRRLQAATPLGRIAKPEELAAVAAFLASEDASFMTGVIMPVNGGMRMD